MLSAAWCSYILHFYKPAKTSRSKMLDKLTYFVKVKDSDSGRCGIGEVALFQGLSVEDSRDFEQRLNEACKNINYVSLNDIKESSIRFGFETAIADIKNGGVMQPFGTVNKPWSHEINGLVWMADKKTMLRQAEEKINAGFKCIKLKIGGIDFREEIAILQEIRELPSGKSVEIRLDANGAFLPGEALDKLHQLSKFNIHSIEQPIKAGQWEEMAEICNNSPIPIALDEELIGIRSRSEKQRMLSFIEPNYIILKPSLCGGFTEADEWIECAERSDIGWWATSALESDIGLNAIARWLSEKDFLRLPQGLGTGQLYIDNFPSPLKLEGSSLTVDYKKRWNLSALPI